MLSNQKWRKCHKKAQVTFNMKFDGQNQTVWNLAISKYCCSAHSKLFLSSFDNIGWIKNFRDSTLKLNNRIRENAVKKRPHDSIKFVFVSKLTITKQSRTKKTSNLFHCRFFSVKPSSLKLYLTQ